MNNKLFLCDYFKCSPDCKKIKPVGIISKKENKDFLGFEWL